MLNRQSICNFISSKLVVLFLLTTSINFTVESQTASKAKFLIKGKVTHNEFPLRDVNIIIKNTNIGTKTNAYGDYTLNAQEGDILQFSHLGYATISIKIKGDKNMINLEMIPETNILEETLLKLVKKNYKDLKEHEKKFSTSKENIDPRSAGYRISYIKGDEISLYVSLTSALLSRFPSYSVKSRSEGVQLGFIRNQPVLWDVDGRVSEIEPDLILSNIKDIRFLGPSAAVNYGKRCHGLEGVGSIRSCGGVIVIRMKKGTEDATTPEEKNRINKILASIQNTNQIKKYNSMYSETIGNIDDANKAFTYCKKILKRKKSNYQEDLRLINDFYQQYENVDLFKNLSVIYVNKYNQNTNALKAMAYELQALQLKDESIKIYKNIFNQGIKNAQSYRDLANAFIENGDFKNADKLYVDYLKESSNFSKKDIDNIIYNELEWLHYSKNSNFSSQHKFVPIHKSKEEFSKDVRLVLEWNNPSASFHVKFNNKEQGLTTYENNADLSSKEQFFPIQEFLISKLGGEDWDIDLIYFGDAKMTTYFKVTCYYNWGKDNQYNKIKTFNLEGDFDKARLFKLSSSALARE